MLINCPDNLCITFGPHRLEINKEKMMLSYIYDRDQCSSNSHPGDTMKDMGDVLSELLMESKSSNNYNFLTLPKVARIQNTNYTSKKKRNSDYDYLDDSSGYGEKEMDKETTKKLKM